MSTHKKTNADVESIVLDDVTFERVRRAIKRPPPPTPQLVALFRRPIRDDR